MLMVFTEDFFLNNKKIPLLLLLFHDNCFITDFKENAELFNSFFYKQYSLIAHLNKLPTNLNYVTDQRLSTITFSAEDVGQIIRSLDPNKGCGHDNITIRMLKICADTICKSLETLSNKSWVRFHLNRKKEILSLFTKNDRQNLKNYHPASLLHICGKILEKRIFDKIFRFHVENKLITLHQSDFKPGNLCFNELLSVTPEIYY